MIISVHFPYPVWLNPLKMGLFGDLLVVRGGIILMPLTCYLTSNFKTKFDLNQFFYNEDNISIFNIIFVTIVR
jgi:hypothetical protein